LDFYAGIWLYLKIFIFLLTMNPVVEIRVLTGLKIKMKHFQFLGENKNLKK